MLAQPHTTSMEADPSFIEFHSAEPGYACVSDVIHISNVAMAANPSYSKAQMSQPEYSCSGMSYSGSPRSPHSTAPVAVICNLHLGYVDVRPSNGYTSAAPGQPIHASKSNIDNYTSATKGPSSFLWLLYCLLLLWSYFGQVRFRGCSKAQESHTRCDRCSPISFLC